MFVVLTTSMWETNCRPCRTGTMVRTTSSLISTREPGPSMWTSWVLTWAKPWSLKQVFLWRRCDHGLTFPFHCLLKTIPWREGKVDISSLLQIQFLLIAVTYWLSKARDIWQALALKLEIHCILYTTTEILSYWPLVSMAEDGKRARMRGVKKIMQTMTGELKFVF